MTKRRQQSDDGIETYAIVTKQKSNPFFDVVITGCENEAERRNREAGRTVVICYHNGTAPEETEANEQVAIIQRLSNDPTIDGIAISVIDAETVTPAINEAVEKGIPVITYDSDAPKSKRYSYIGTNNDEMGRFLARTLHRLKPTGGVYGLLSDTPPNLREREQGFRNYMKAYPQWTETKISPLLSRDSIPLSLEQMEKFAALQPNMHAIVPVGGWPMFDTDTSKWKNFVDANRNLSLVVADTLEVQVDLLSVGYADALIGQVPVEMGINCIQVLSEIRDGREPEEERQLTFLMEMVKVPLVLPELNIDFNTLGNLRYVGYSAFAIITIFALSCIAWTWFKRKVRVVRASQPLFLIMIALGAWIMGSTLVPLSFEDSPSYEDAKKEVIVGDTSDADRACMALPWLGSIGFVVTFSALFSKTWRINKIFHSRRAAHARITVKERDVMIPFILMFTANVVILVCWTVLAPLKYVRERHDGRDLWGRTISTYGACRSSEDNSSLPYLLSLAGINIGLLLVANWQAFEARTIQSEFAESKYIAIVMTSLLQASLSGLPILLIVREIPEAFYLVMVFMILIICMAVLLLIFVPKVLYERKYQKQSNSQRGAAFRAAIQESGRPARQTHRTSMIGRFMSMAGSARSKHSSSLSNLARNTAMADPPSTSATHHMSLSSQQEDDSLRSDSAMLYERKENSRIIIPLGEVEEGEEDEEEGSRASQAVEDLGEEDTTGASSPANGCKHEPPLP